MVRGRGMAVTAVALMYQWADTTRIARGRGTAAPKARQAWVYRLSSRAFIGLPWPRKAAGITVGPSELVMLCFPLPSVGREVIFLGRREGSVPVLPGAQADTVAVGVGEHPEARSLLVTHQAAAGREGGIDPGLDRVGVQPHVRVPALPVGLAAGPLEPHGRQHARGVSQLVTGLRYDGVQPEHGRPERQDLLESRGVQGE